MYPPDVCVGIDSMKSDPFGPNLERIGRSLRHAVARSDYTATLCGKVVRELFQFEDWATTRPGPGRCTTCVDRYFEITGSQPISAHPLQSTIDRRQSMGPSVRTLPCPGGPRESRSS